MFIRLPAVVVSLCAVIIGILTEEPRYVLLAHAALLALVAVDALAAPSPKSLAVTRNAPSVTRVGVPVTDMLTVRNTTKRKISGQLRNAWPPSAGLRPFRHTIRVPKGERIRLTSTINPTRRGTRHSEHVTIRTNGPLGLAGRQRTFPSPWEITVLPPFLARKHLPSRVQQLRELEGRALLLIRGEGTEFDSLREYVAGDDIRAIDWRSSARRGETLVRTWRPERDRHVIVVMDAGRAGTLRVDDSPAFDAFIESGLLLAALAERAGDRVSVISYGDELRSRTVGRNGSGRQAGGALMNRIATSVADVDPTLSATDWRGVAQTIDGVSNRQAFVVLLTTINTGTIPSGLLDVVQKLNKRHTVLVAAPQANPETEMEQSELAQALQDSAFARSTMEAAAITGELRRSGAQVVRGTATELPVLVADTYLELKAQGKL